MRDVGHHVFHILEKKDEQTMKQDRRINVKNTQKTIQNHWKIEVRGHQNRGQEGSRRGLGRGSLFFAFWWVLGASCGPNDANMAPNLGSPNRTKIDAKINAKIDASWTSIFGLFFRIFL